MRTEQDGMMLVRADLCERLDALRKMSAKLRGAERAQAAAGIGTVAAAYGLTPVVRLAEALGRSLRDAGSCRSDLYIERLQDAIGCRRLDDEASEAIMASVSVRFS